MNLPKMMVGPQTMVRFADGTCPMRGEHDTQQNSQRQQPEKWRVAIMTARRAGRRFGQRLPAGPGAQRAV
jgi:hypothetical protein